MQLGVCVISAVLCQYSEFCWLCRVEIWINKLLNAERVAVH